MRAPNAPGVGVGPETPTGARGGPDTAGGRDPARDAPHWVQKRVSSAFGWAQEGHDFIRAPPSLVVVEPSVE
jgi:hypothetical protein